MNSIEATTRLAHAATDTLEWINNMWLAHVAHDGVGRTVAGTSATTLTLLGINSVSKQSFTLLSATSVFLHMLNIFIVEVVDCRQHRVWRSLTKSTQCGILDCSSERLQMLNVIHGAFTLGDAS